MGCSFRSLREVGGDWGAAGQMPVKSIYSQAEAIARDSAAAERMRQEWPRLARPFPRLADFLMHYAATLADLSQARTGELRIDLCGRVLWERRGGKLSLQWQDAATIGKAKPSSRLEVALMYADAAMGGLSLSGCPDEAWRSPALLSDCARQLAFMVKRYDVCRWAEQRLGRPLLLIGVSDAIRDLEVFVEKASQSDLPVLLHGEFGTETPYLAAAMHCCGGRRDHPFVQVNCTQPCGTPEEWFQQAEGGSLFLSDIDALDPSLQNLLPRLMYSRLGQWLDVSSTTKVRLIASASSDLRRLVAEGKFSRQLLAELDFLAVAVPPLRERTVDIAPLVVAALERQGYAAEEKIGGGMLELCQAYAWPENVFELERMVARLAVMTGKASIGAEDIHRHFPQMGVRTVQPSIATPESKAEPPSHEIDPSVPDAEFWLRHAIERNEEAMRRLHPGLRKAMLYLVEHYSEPIKLGVLARQSHVSQSHLSFLFRNGLHSSCKALLARIRVEQAKALLAADPHQPITDVALQVGFSDLSHFEKCFRRQVGKTPRDFRRQGME
jgi:AraC-like DNA-binding protein